MTVLNHWSRGKRTELIFHSGQRWLAILSGMALVVALLATGAAAGEPKSYTAATFEAWLGQYAGAKPDFKTGDVLGAKDLGRIQPFAPPGFFEQLNFTELRMKIMARRSHRPRADYMACTEKYQPQVRLSNYGTLANYVCGEPFAAHGLSTRDPSSGLKAAWNLQYRWQNYGQLTLSSFYILDRFGGSHAGQIPLVEAPPQDWLAGLNFSTRFPSAVSQNYRGGGSFDRIMSSLYQRVYFSHLAQAAEQGGLLATPDAKDFLYKEFTGFFLPFDIRGQVIIDYRYADSDRADDAWAYDPKLRRVRRISAEVKSDSLLGTDTTIDDFYTFSGHQSQWNWKFLGFKDVLCVMDAQHDYAHLYGPNCILPDDAWSLRRFAVVKRTPKAPNYPYGSVITFWDAENWHPWIEIAFGRDQRLWKVAVYENKWTEDFRDWAEFNHGVESTIPIAQLTVDVQAGRGTIFTGFGTGYANVSLDHVTRLFDVNKLEEVHR